MRILTWNINGIRTLPHYHPWSQLKTCENILPELNADVICFQEMKSSRKDLDQQTAVPSPYDSFFSFPKTKGGYSGVAVYTNPSSAIASKAEEGLTGIMQPKPPLTPLERVSSSSLSYPRAEDLPLLSDDENGVPAPRDLNELDSEGRALVLDFGLFVLINTYCPNDASDARMIFKMNYHFMLEARVKALIDEGREVMVVGDINVVSALIDHAEGNLESRKAGFLDAPHRRWFRAWLEEGGGPMIDIVRRFWPDREGMYTCWNTKLNARESNYGARIDYILVTRGLLPWIKHGDIQPSIRGSDHCPVYVDLHDEITFPDGQRKVLRDEMGGRSDLGSEGTTPDTARIAAKFWDEYSGKQTLLSSFFGQGGMKPKPTVRIHSHSSSTKATSSISSPAPAPEPTPTLSTDPVDDPQPSLSSASSPPSPTAPDEGDNLLGDASIMKPSPPTTTPTPSSSVAEAQEPSSLVTDSFSLKRKRSTSEATSIPTFSQLSQSSSATKPKPSSTTAPSKKTRSSQDSASSAKGKKQASSSTPKSGSQSKLSAFFTTPTPATGKKKGGKLPEKEAVVLSDDSDSGDAAQSAKSPDEEMDLDRDHDKQVDDDYAYALSLAEADEEFLQGQSSQSQSSSISSSSPTVSKKDAQAVWSKLTAPLVAPRCTVHNEPAKQYTVNKPGPNKGKVFFLCSRPVGPGYDAGRSIRLREEVDVRYKCDFFKWASDVRKQQLQREKAT
ncbi:DNase I-like protein [Clavulina sp. PMI_390]|nr:DNase I-like protein [Clavulina sp. PMI_390]